MNINPIVTAVTFILQIYGSKPAGSATGFFYIQNNNLFLVTNKHVCLNDKKGIRPDALRLHLHKDPNNIADNGIVDIPLYKNQKPLWKSHPQYPDADIALIKLDREKIQKSFFIKPFSKYSFLPQNYRLDPGEDIFIMGYPLAFYDNKNNLPIFRNAMIASTYRVNFQNLPLFLTDATLHPGTSGSPVITKPKNVWIDDKGTTNMVTGTHYYLVGVHSGTVDPNITGGINVGLGAAWYAELIEDIASSF
ncbi:MAG: serine protease [Planctomycetes bacterium]|nr:serine protease [Planctomycetota bacterium]MBU1518376.1 serine protease [Planctomycetota bacterium]MBU2457358.1 serine protease [Planctomycetota bacterium]MBU2597533.1 serine protease [Planctomycetota bacterium]